MIRIAAIASVLAYAIVVSQPLAYLVFLTKAQRALSAPAYIELRQRINPVMSRRLGWIYLGALATVVLLLVLSLRSGSWNVLAAATVALLCLLVDGMLMLRENVPINSVIDRWSITDYPADWQDYRSKWFAVFGRRQVVLLVGFLSLVVGAVIQ
jgi:hypothetical protein